MWRTDNLAWVIKDLRTDEYYRQRAGKSGWYSVDINDSRLYSSLDQAQKTIDQGGHHVTYPGARDLVVLEVKIVEIS